MEVRFRGVKRLSGNILQAGLYWRFKLDTGAWDTPAIVRALTRHGRVGVGSSFSFSFLLIAQRVMLAV